MAIALLQSTRAFGNIGLGGPRTTITTNPLSFASPTTAGSLLVCVIVATVTSVAAPGAPTVIPSVSAPITAGVAWTQVASSGFTDSTGNNGPDLLWSNAFFGAGLAIYYATNVPSLPTSVSTQFTATQPNAAYNMSSELQLYEFSGAVSLDVQQSQATGADILVGRPATANLVTSATDLIFVAYTAPFQGKIAAGSGYVDGLGNDNNSTWRIQAQYILNQNAGNIGTAFGVSTDSHPGALLDWACIAAAFKSAVQPSAGKLLAFYRLDGSGGGVPPSGHDAEIPSGTINGGNVTFSLAFSPVPAASVFLYKNGNFMVQGTDYALGMSPGSSIGVITMAKAPASGDHLIAWYRSDGGTLGIADNETPLGVIDGTNPDFTLAHSALPGTLVLFQRKADGSSCISLAPTGIDYTNAGTLILLNIAPAVGDTLRAFYRYTPLS